MYAVTTVQIYMYFEGSGSRDGALLRMLVNHFLFQPGSNSDERIADIRPLVRSSRLSHAEGIDVNLRCPPLRLLATAFLISSTAFVYFYSVTQYGNVLAAFEPAHWCVSCHSACVCIRAADELLSQGQYCEFLYGKL